MGPLCPGPFCPAFLTFSPDAATGVTLSCFLNLSKIILCRSYIYGEQLGLSFESRVKVTPVDCKAVLTRGQLGGSLFNPHGSTNYHAISVVF